MQNFAAVQVGATNSLLLPLSAPAAGNAELVGPKAANLAALARAGLQTPGGFCLTAHAYRGQMSALGLDELAASLEHPDSPAARKISVEIRLALYEQPIAPAILAPLLDAWRAQRA